MNSNTVKSASSERETNALNGWMMLVVNLGLMFSAIAWVIWLIEHSGKPDGDPGILLLAPALLEVLAIFLITGFFTLQPNEARVLILFGAYKGTMRQSGFHWCNPFYSVGHKISLRARTLTVEKLKVNEKQGNPIEIVAVVVWRVANTAQAVFDVDDY